MSRRDRGGAGFELFNGMQVPSLIKSIQRGTITLTGTSNTATIGAVNPSNTLLRIVGTTTDTGGGASSRIRITLTNSTTITATRASDGGGTTVAVAYEVVEYYHGIIQAIQRGTIGLTAPATSNTATINVVNVNKTELRSLGSSGTGATHPELDTRLELTNSTTVTAIRSSGVDDVVAAFEAVTWY